MSHITRKTVFGGLRPDSVIYKLKHQQISLEVDLTRFELQNQQCGSQLSVLEQESYRKRINISFLMDGHTHEVWCLSMVKREVHTLPQLKMGVKPNTVSALVLTHLKFL